MKVFRVPLPIVVASVEDREMPFAVGDMECMKRTCVERIYKTGKPVDGKSFNEWHYQNTCLLYTSIESYTRKITTELLASDKLFGHKASDCACPKCGKGTMQFYGKVVRCDSPERSDSDTSGAAFFSKVING